MEYKIKIVEIDLADWPVWYKEKVYLRNKVPSLEHNKQEKESLDLVKYIDNNFKGSSQCSNKTGAAHGLPKKEKGKKHLE